jgi:CDGSH-type Zn-finger protein
MTEAVVAGRTPIGIELDEGKSYFWCSCGRSNKQPFCDGSHKETTFTPMKYDAGQSGKKFFCACKQTSTPPFCDGSHKQLVE